MDKKFELFNNSGQSTGVDVVVIGDCINFEECGSFIMDIYKDEVDGLIAVLQEIKKKRITRIWGMINSAEELADFFWFCGLQMGVHSVNVVTKVKKEIMTGRWQNKVTCNHGCVVEINWKNQGGGVWQASVEVV